MIVEHHYGQVKFISRLRDNSHYECMLNGVSVTGTASVSRGEACMRMMVFIDDMLDQESKPIQAGDILVLPNDETQESEEWLIEAFEVKPHGVDTLTYAHVRLGLEPATLNFRGPTSAHAIDQSPKVALGGGPFRIVPLDRKLVWLGDNEVDFVAWVNTAGGDRFRYTKTVNVWG